MTADLRRSFKQKAKQAFELPSRLRKGITDRLDGSDDSGGALCDGGRPMSFDFGCLVHEDHPNNDFNEMNQSNKECTVGARSKSRNPVQPVGTFKYQVSSEDTLRSLAARHETTSSELKKINRFVSDTIFEGQIIFIPDATLERPLTTILTTACSVQNTTNDTSLPAATPCSPPILIKMTSSDSIDVTTASTTLLPVSEAKQAEVELLSYKPLQKLLYGGQDLFFTGIKPILSATRHVTQDVGSGQKLSSSNVNDENTESSYEFIKVSAKHISDRNQVISHQEVSSAVSGLLLLSADFVMFDPDPNDMQSQGQSLEELSLIIPILNVVSVTLSKNIVSLTGSNGRLIAEEESKKSLKEVVPECVNKEEPQPILPTLVTSEDGFEDAKISDKCLESQAEEVYICPRGIKESIIELDDSRDKIEHADASKERFFEMHQNREKDLDSAGKKRTKSTSEVRGIERRIDEDNDREVSVTPAEKKGLDKRRASSVKRERPLSIVGNFFRLGGIDSLTDSNSTSSVDGDGKDGAVGNFSSAENITSSSSSPGGSRLVTRTLSSLSSYSSSLMDDFSSHLFASPSGTPRLQAISASPSSPVPSPSAILDRPGERAFFLKPIDALTKKVKEQLSSSTDSAGDDEDKDSELYLHFKTINAQSSCCTCDLTSEYLFLVSPDRGPTFFTFFLYWSPNSQNIQPNNLPFSDEPWFVLADKTQGGSCAADKQQFKIQEIEQKKKSKEWKIVNLFEVKRLLRLMEIENLPLPDLSVKSHILDEQMIRQLTFHLPPRAEGSMWHLVYSTERHGFSLKTLFRRTEGVEGPVLLVIKDDKNQVFGAMLSCTLKSCDFFYGTGESYLFSFYKSFKKYSWTGMNNYFIYSQHESISIGCGDGAFGLWLDGDLYYGRSQSCLTFGNSPLTENEDFVVKCLETWRFM